MTPLSLVNDELDFDTLWLFEKLLFEASYRLLNMASSLAAAGVHGVAWLVLQGRVGEPFSVLGREYLEK